MTDLEQVMVNALTVIPFTPPMPSSPLDRGRFPSGRGELGTEANAYLKLEGMHLLFRCLRSYFAHLKTVLEVTYSRLEISRPVSDRSCELVRPECRRRSSYALQISSCMGYLRLRMHKDLRISPALRIRSAVLFIDVDH